MENNKIVLGKPDSLLLVLFGIEILFVGYILFSGGLEYVNNDTSNMKIFIPIGLLTFVSIFYGFIFSPKNYLMAAHEKRMELKDSLFKRELEFCKDKKSLEDWKIRYADFKEYKSYVNPTLWLYVSIFLSLMTILISLSNINGIERYISLLIHLNILTTFFLVTSIACWIISYYLEDKKNKLLLDQYNHSNYQ